MFSPAVWTVPAPAPKPAPKPLHTKYTQQIIFVLNNLWSRTIDEKVVVYGGHCDGDVIRDHTQQKNSFAEPTIIVPLIINAYGYVVETKDLLNALKKIDNKTRIYIIGHCGPGSNVLSGADTSITASGLAYTIAKNMNGQFLRNTPRTYNAQKLRISLIACHAGTPSGTAPAAPPGCVNNSFAARFLFELYYQRISCTIVARLGTMYHKDEKFAVRKPQLKLQYKKLTLLRKFLLKKSYFIPDAAAIKRSTQLLVRIDELNYPDHDKNSKAEYFYNTAGVQEVKSAYDPGQPDWPEEPMPLSDEESFAWFTGVAEAINDCIDETRSSVKIAGLYRLLDYMFADGRTNRDIEQEIKAELNSAGVGKYNINIHSNPVSQWRGAPTRTHVKLRDALSSVYL